MRRNGLSRRQVLQGGGIAVVGAGGQPVLTWWEGQVIKGYGEGKVLIADTSYRTIATIEAGHGLHVDLHEFVISPQDTALITAYRPRTTDLSTIGGPAQGVALSGVAGAAGRLAAAACSCGHAYPARPARVSPPAPTTAIPLPWSTCRRLRPPRLTCRTSALYTLDVHLMTWGSSQERIQGFAEMSQSSLNAPSRQRRSTVRLRLA